MAGTLLGNENEKQTFNTFSESIETLVNAINEEIKSRKESKGTGKIEDGIKLNDNKFYETLSLNIGEVSTNVKDIKEHLLGLDFLRVKLDNIEFINMSAYNLINKTIPDFLKELKGIFDGNILIFDRINDTLTVVRDIFNTLLGIDTVIYNRLNDIVKSKDSDKKPEKTKEVKSSDKSNIQLFDKKKTTLNSSVTDVVEFVKTIQNIDVANVAVNDNQINTLIKNVISIANSLVTGINNNMKKQQKLKAKADFSKITDFVTKSLTALNNVTVNLTEFDKSDILTKENQTKIGDKLTALTTIFNNVIGIVSKIKFKDFISLYRNLIIIDQLNVGKMIGNMLFKILNSFNPKGGLTQESLVAAKGAEAISTTLKQVFELFNPKNFLRNLIGVTMFSTSMKSVLEILVDMFENEKYGLKKLTDGSIWVCVTDLLGSDPTKVPATDDNGKPKPQPKGILAGIKTIIGELVKLLNNIDIDDFIHLIVGKRYLKSLADVLIGEKYSIKKIIEELGKLKNIEDFEKTTRLLKDVFDALSEVFKSAGESTKNVLMALVAIPAMRLTLFGLGKWNEEDGNVSILGITKGLSNVAFRDDDFEAISGQEGLLHHLTEIFKKLKEVFNSVIGAGVVGIVSLPFVYITFFVLKLILNKLSTMLGISKQAKVSDKELGIQLNILNLFDAIKNDKEDYYKNGFKGVSEILESIAHIFKSVIILGVLAIPAAVGMLLSFIPLKLLPKFVNWLQEALNAIGSDRLKKDISEKIKELGDVILSLKNIFVSVIIAGIVSVLMLPFLPIVTIAIYFLTLIVKMVEMISIDEKRLAGFAIGVKELMKTLLWYALSVLVITAVFLLIKPFREELFVGLGIFLGIILIVSLMTLIIKFSIGEKGLHEFAISVKLIMQSILWYAIGVLAVTWVFNYVSATNGWLNLGIGLFIFVLLIGVVVGCVALLKLIGGTAGIVVFSIAVLLLMSSLLVFSLGLLALYNVLQLWNENTITTLIKLMFGLTIAFNPATMVVFLFAAIPLILIGAGLLMLSLGLMILHFAVDMWVKNDLIEQFKTLLKGIAKGINEMMDVLLGMPPGSNIGGTGAGGNVLDNFLGMFAAVFAAGAILVISVSLLIFAIALTFLGLAVMLWQSYVNIEDLKEIMVGVAEGIRLMTNALLGQTTGSPQKANSGHALLDGAIGLLTAVFNAGAIIVVSVSLLVFSVALGILGAAILLWDSSKIELLKQIMRDIAGAIKDMVDTLFGKKGRSGIGGFIEGFVANIPVIGDLVGALGAVAKMGAIILLSVALVTFGAALKNLGEGIDAVKGKTKSFEPIAYNIGQGVKQLLNAFGDADEDEIENVKKISEALVIFGTAIRALSNINFENLRNLAPENGESVLKKVVKSIKDSLNSFSGAENEGMSNSIQSLQKTVNAIVKLCYGLQVLKSENQLSNVALGVGKIQSTIEKTQPTPKALKSFSTIMYYLCKIAKSADGFERFTQSFKNFTKDMEKFKETLNGIDADKLKDWVKLSEITLKLSEENQQFDKFATYFNEKFKEFNSTFSQIMQEYTKFEEAKAQIRADEFKDLKTALANASEEQRNAILDAYGAADGTSRIVEAINKLGTSDNALYVRQQK